MADETNPLRVRLVTPERTLFEHTVTAVLLPAKNGYFEVLPGAAPLMAELGAGDVTLLAARWRQALQRQLGLCRSSAGAGHHSRLRRPQARRNRCASRRKTARPRPADVEGSRRKRRCLHGGSSRHRRGRSQNGFCRRQELTGTAKQKPIFDGPKSKGLAL